MLRDKPRVEPWTAILIASATEETPTREPRSEGAGRSESRRRGWSCARDGTKLSPLHPGATTVVLSLYTKPRAGVPNRPGRRGLVDINQ